jgi:hypothetical protein
MAEQPNHPLRSRLGIRGEVNVCMPSFDTDDRHGIADLIIENHHDGTVLIKGQTHDILTREFPQRFKTLPGFQQEVVFVWATAKVLAERCAVRARECDQLKECDRFHYFSSQTESSCRDEMYVWQIPAVRGLGLPTTCVSTDRGLVEIGEDPPDW